MIFVVGNIFNIWGPIFLADKRCKYYIQVFGGFYGHTTAVQCTYCNLGIGIVYSVRQKKVSPHVICHFLSNHLEFLREILLVYYLFIYT